MPELITINGESVRPGEHKNIRIFIHKLPTHTVIDLSVDVFRGRADGPVLLLTAGLHGDEINGIETLRRLIRDRSIWPEVGTVIVIPIVNIYGFLQNSRVLPDGKDLNRSFPGSAMGSLAQRVAHAIMREVLPVVDYGIDFHTGGASRSNFPQVRCVLDVPINRELGFAFGAPFLLHSSLIDKSFRKAAARAGKYILVYEGGESMRFDERAIREGMAGTLRVMYHLGMRRGVQPPPAQSTLLTHSSWVRARQAGLFIPLVQLGDRIERNQQIGKLADPFGDAKALIVKAPHDSYVIGLNYTPVVNGGDALFHLGQDETLRRRDRRRQQREAASGLDQPTE